MEATGRARVGLIGCGDVTRLYLPNLARYPQLRLVACADLDPGRASALSADQGIPSVDVDDLIADPSVDVILNLTPPAAHATVSRAAIAAGKHVYSEKPLATTRADALAVLAEAAAAGVRVAGAPDTFLGGGLQTARAVLDAGEIGRPVLAAAAFLSLGPERWHHRPASFYAAGAGPLLDVAPYYVTALVHLLGPVESVTAAGNGIGSVRTVGAGPDAGKPIVSTVPTSVVATLSFASGAVGSLQASFDAAGTQAPFLEIHGDAGSMTIGDPNWFDGAVRRHAPDGDGWEAVPFRFDPTVGRGIGLADFVDAIRDGRPARASGAFAFHVLDVLLSIEAAVASGQRERVASTVERPAPLDVTLDG